MSTVNGSYYRMQTRSQQTGEMIQALSLRDAVRFDTLTASATAATLKVAAAQWEAPDYGIVVLRSDANEQVRASGSGSDPGANTHGLMWASETTFFAVQPGDVISVKNA